MAISEDSKRESNVIFIVPSIKACNYFTLLYFTFTASFTLLNTYQIPYDISISNSKIRRSAEINTLKELVTALKRWMSSSLKSLFNFSSSGGT